MAGLVSDTSFQRAGTIDQDVPAGRGIYANRPKVGSTLPEPLESLLALHPLDLHRKAASLKSRMLGNELQGRGHGTFFRSVGAVLGYRPLVGSLATKVNKYNFSFETPDHGAVVKWIDKNLEVSWGRPPPGRLLAPITRGLTIVELLIVIVVIAILAAITAVGYTGIENRARASAAQASAKQTFTSIQTCARVNLPSQLRKLEAQEERLIELAANGTGALGKTSLGSRRLRRSGSSSTAPRKRWPTSNYSATPRSCSSARKTMFTAISPGPSFARS